MLEMRPRTKVVADFAHARITPADVICIFAQDHATRRSGDTDAADFTHVDWGNTSTCKRADVFESLLTCMGRGDVMLSYPHGTTTQFDFGSVADAADDVIPWYENGRQVLRYRATAAIDPIDRCKVAIVLFEFDRYDAVYHPLAKTTLDFEYFDDMGTLDYGGTDDEWDKVEE